MSCHEVLSLEDFQPSVKSEEAQFAVSNSLEKEAVEYNAAQITDSLEIGSQETGELTERTGEEFQADTVFLTCCCFCSDKRVSY